MYGALIGELVDRLHRGKIDLCCAEETRRRVEVREWRHNKYDVLSDAQENKSLSNAGCEGDFK